MHNSAENIELLEIKSAQLQSEHIQIGGIE